MAHSRRWFLPLALAVLLTSPSELAAQAGAGNVPGEGAVKPPVAAQPPAPQPPSTPAKAPGPTAGGTIGAAGEAIAGVMKAFGNVVVLLVVACVLAVLALTTYRLVGRFLVALDQRSSIGTRGHWGGFGGADTGWEVSPALAILIAALVLALVTAGLGSALVGVTMKPAERSPAPAAPPATGEKAAK